MKRLVPILFLLVSSTAMADWTLKGTGTAFVVNNNYALTAAHVLKECDGASIRHQHKEMEAEIVVLDVPNDLGLLLLKEPFEHTAKFRGGKAIRLGDTVVNYGYPLFGQLSDHAKVTTGEINSLAGWNNDSREIQYNAATQPGNSGGPVLDQSGNIVGVVTSGLSGGYAEETGHIAQSVNFAVKSFVAEAFLSANGVDFEREESTEEMKTADIAEKAETFTVLVGCWEGFAESEQTIDESAPTTPTTPLKPLVGVGFRIWEKNDRLLITSVYEGTSAYKGSCEEWHLFDLDSKLEGKDGNRDVLYYFKMQKDVERIFATCPIGKRIFAVDGVDVRDISPPEVVKLLRGKKGTTVKIEFDGSEGFERTFERVKYNPSGGALSAHRKPLWDKAPYRHIISAPIQHPREDWLVDSVAG